MYMHEDKKEERITLVSERVIDYGVAWNKLDFNTRRMLARDNNLDWGTI